MKKTLLVTGGAGFIGANFVHYWLKKNTQDGVIVLDALTYAGNKASLESVADNSNFEFVHGDICDTSLVETLLSEKGIDTIVHFAAESHVDRSITGPDAFIETNIIGTYSLLKAAKKIWIDVPKASGQEPVEHRFHHLRMKCTVLFRQRIPLLLKKPLTRLIRRIQQVKQQAIT
jgi:dTDP-glucose 4,6-dehydratase